MQLKDSVLCPVHHLMWIINQENDNSNKNWGKKCLQNAELLHPFQSSLSECLGPSAPSQELRTLPISHWLGKESLWGYGCAGAAAFSPCQWRQGDPQLSMAGNYLKYTRSAKMTQNYLPQQFTLEHSWISRGRVRFWPGSFRAFWAHGSHMRTVYLRAGFEHPNDSMGFLCFHEASWCCSLTWLSSKIESWN